MNQKTSIDDSPLMSSEALLALLRENSPASIRPKSLTISQGPIDDIEPIFPDKMRMEAESNSKESQTATNTSNIKEWETHKYEGSSNVCFKDAQKGILIRRRRVLSMQKEEENNKDFCPEHDHQARRVMKEHDISPMTKENQEQTGDNIDAFVEARKQRKVTFSLNVETVELSEKIVPTTTKFKGSAHRSISNERNVATSFKFHRQRIILRAPIGRSNIASESVTFNNDSMKKNSHEEVTNDEKSRNADARNWESADNISDKLESRDGSPNINSVELAQRKSLTTKFSPILSPSIKINNKMSEPSSPDRKGGYYINGQAENYSKTKGRIDTPQIGVNLTRLRKLNFNEVNDIKFRNNFFQSSNATHFLRTIIPQALSKSKENSRRPPFVQKETKSFVS